MEISNLIPLFHSSPTKTIILPEDSSLFEVSHSIAVIFYSVL